MKIKLNKCIYCGEKVAYIFENGKKIIIQPSQNKDIIYKIHSCDVEENGFTGKTEKVRGK